MSKHSIKKRYLFTLASRLVALVMGIATAGIVPRALGPENYGNFQFMYNSITGIKNFVEMGTSSAFLTESSKNPKTGMSILLYALWEVFQIAGIFAFIALSIIFGYYSKIWPGQMPKFIIALTGISILTLIQDKCLSFSDTKTLTVVAQIIKLISHLVQITLIVSLFLIGSLDINGYILINYITISLCTISLTIFLYRNRNIFYISDHGIEKFKSLLKYYFNYCSPLVIYSLVGFMYMYFNRWFLQLISGGIEQGYFSVAFNWSQIIMLFTVSLIPIYSREIALAFGLGDKDRVVFLFSKFTKMLYCLTAYFAAFIFAQSDFLVTQLAGSNFSGAVFPFMIAAFYPLHQTYGQITGAIFYSTERTREYSQIGVCGMLIGMVLSYLLLAPKTYLIPGLNLGAIGLALQLVIYNIIVVNILHYRNCRYFKISYFKFLIHQFAVIIAFLIIAFASKYYVYSSVNYLRYSYLFQYSNVDTLFGWLIFLLSVFFYSVIIATFLFFMPHLSGLDKTEIKTTFYEILNPKRKT